MKNKILDFKGDYKGLDNQAVQDNLRHYGYNSQEKHIYLHYEDPPKIKFYRVFKSFRIYLMLAAAIIYLFAEQPAKAVFMLFLTLGICALEIIAENHCTKKLCELTNTARVIVRVVREGEIVLVRREEIVQDDLLLLQGGETVPADAHILESRNVTADESAFTGTKHPVKKGDIEDNNRELKPSSVYKGTKILTGTLIARVFNIGQDVLICTKDRRRRGADSRKRSYTELDSFFAKPSALLTAISAVSLVAVMLIRILSGGGSFVDESNAQTDVTALMNLAKIILPAFSFALCALPLSLRMIIRLFYVNGATAMSYKYGEIKQLRAVETLNSVTALCVDRDIIVDPDSTPLVSEISGNKDMHARVGALACATGEMNACEKAILIDAAFKHIDVKALHKNTLIKAYPPEKGDYNKLHGNLWEINGIRLMCVKGTPEAVLSFCNLEPERLYAIQKQHSDYMREGNYVLATAFARFDVCDEEGNPIAPPKSVYDVAYSYSGLTAFSTSLNDSVKQAVKNCHKAGVKVIMMTCDSLEAAKVTAEKAGIKEDNIQTGVNTPFDKAQLVETLKSKGETVAVFGKCNADTDALETADAGISLSRNTVDRNWDFGGNDYSDSVTGSACEASDFTIDGDGFTKISQMFSDTRNLHRNIKRCISVVLSVFIAIFIFGFAGLFAIGEDGLAYVPEAALISTAAIIATIHTVFLYMNNNADAGTKMRPSKFISKNRVNRDFVFGILIQGMSLFAALSLMYVIFKGNANFYAQQHRAVFFVVFISGLAGMSWVNLSYDKPFYRIFTKEGLKRDWKNTPAVIMTAALAVFMPFAVYLPFIRAAFAMGKIDILVFFMAIFIGLISQLWFDFIKRRFYK